jgi:hypothetical protein
MASGGNIMLGLPKAVPGGAKPAAAGAGKKPKSATLYLGHVPHNFYEPAMRAYFGQFGEVQRLRLARSKKTARSKGYAFIEFAGARTRAGGRQRAAQQACVPPRTRASLSGDDQQMTRMNGGAVGCWAVAGRYARSLPVRRARFRARRRPARPSANPDFNRGICLRI